MIQRLFFLLTIFICIIMHLPSYHSNIYMMQISNNKSDKYNKQKNENLFYAKNINIFCIMYFWKGMLLGGDYVSGATIPNKKQTMDRLCFETWTWNGFCIRACRGHIISLHCWSWFFSIILNKKN